MLACAREGWRSSFGRCDFLERPASMQTPAGKVALAEQTKAADSVGQARLTFSLRDCK